MTLDLRRGLGVLATIVCAGIAIRLAPLGLDPAFRKWGGSVLWGAMSWCLAALIARGRPRYVVIVLALAFSALSEGLKLLHYPLLDAVRTTRMGAFLLGRQFSAANLGAYFIGVLLISPFRIRRKTPPSR